MEKTTTIQRSAILIAVLLVGSVVAGGMAVMAQETPGEDSSGEIDTQQTTYLRVIHASPGAPSVDVSLNNETVLEDVSFGDLSDYLTVSAGEYTVTVTAADDPEAVVFEGTVTLEPRMAQTLAVTGQLATDGAVTDETDGMMDNETETETVEDLDPNATETETDETMATNETDNETVGNETDAMESGLEPILYEDNAFEPDNETAALSIAHFSPDAPAVDVTTANGTVLAANVSFQEATDYVTVPAGDYTVQIRGAVTPPADNVTDENVTETPAEENETVDTENETAVGTGPVVAEVDVSLEGGTAYSAMAIGLVTPAEDETMDEAASDTGFSVLLTEDATTVITLPSEAMDDETATVTEEEEPTTEEEEPTTEEEETTTEEEEPTTEEEETTTEEEEPTTEEEEPTTEEEAITTEEEPAETTVGNETTTEEVGT